AHSGNHVVGEQAPDFGSSNARVLERLLEAHPLRNLFPMYNWEARPQEARARALVVMAALFVKYGQAGRAMELLRESRSETPTLGALAVEGLICHSRQDFQRSSQLFAEALASQ